MENLTDILKRFSPISLQEMDGVELMNRTDTKFMIHKNVLFEILNELPESYRVLEVNGNRASHYETLYFDTPDFLYYRRHHAGKKNRLKIRKRSYLESAITFLEVKFKSNKDRTIKDRTKVQSLEGQLEERAVQFIERETGVQPYLEAKLKNAFTRTTFVFPDGPERITIDTELSFDHEGLKVELPNVVVIEVKQSKKNRHSAFMQCLKNRYIRQESFSKYCLGVALVHSHIKHNAFKEKLNKIKRIERWS